ncbi:hypothetical protein KAW08_05670 [bacterium]|nr:hypothetical protein [bacterium]
MSTLQKSTEKQVKDEHNKKFTGWVILGIVFAIAVLLFIRAGSGKYGQKKLSTESELSERVENIVREVISAAPENRASVLAQHVYSDTTENNKLHMLNSLEKLSNAKEYRLHSVARYGKKIVKAIFNYSDVNGRKKQSPFLFFEEKDQLTFLAIP